MKDIAKYINENNSFLPGYKGSSFKEEVSYKKSDFDKWMKMWTNGDLPRQDIIVSHYGKDTDLVLIYFINGSNGKPEHIASYNVKKEILMTDDIKLFGNES